MVHTRRQARGYTFEKQLVTEFNKGNWQARRLGGSSSGLPDVGIVNNEQSILYAIEAKSTVYNFCEVPVKQIVRCLDYLKLHSIYKTKNVILAFRFATKRALLAEKTKVKISRIQPKYYFIIVKKFKRLEEVEAFTCNSKGKMTFKIYDYNPDEYYNFDDFAEVDKVTSINDLKHYGWDSRQSSFDHLFTI